MLKKFHDVFQKLPSSTKSMVFIMWLYFFGQVVANVFIGIYIYQISQSFFDIAIYNILLFFGAFISFVGLGLLAGIYKWNIKNFYFGGYLLFILSFLIILLVGETKIGVYIFGILYGAGIGLYYNAVHTQELNNITKISRNHYSSSVTIGKNIIESLLPLLLAGLFYLGSIYDFEIYPVLFISLICVYIIGLFKIKGIENYYPNKINKIDITNFCNLKKYKYGHLYFLNNGITHILFSIVLSIVAIYFLKNEVNIGLFQGILAIIGTILIIYTSFKRDDNNLYFYYALFSILIFINFIVFSLNFTLIGYVIFLLISLIIAPLYRVSEHIYDLATMDNVKTDMSDFYPAMVLREVILWVGRLIAFIFVVILFYYFEKNIELLIRLLLLLVGLSCVTQVLLIKLWENNEKIDNN